MEYLVEPEVAGGLGANSVVDTTTTPITVTTLHYAVDGWLGSELLESWPVWVATDHFVDTVSAAGLTGYTTAPAQVDLTPQGQDALAGRQLPHFMWFQVGGVRGDDDFSMCDAGLLVSARALEVIRPMLGEDVVIESHA